MLAERRARRAEIAEESLADRIKAAERFSDEQRVRALELEHSLQAAAIERDGLRADLEAREADLRALRQREESERRRRREVEVEADRDRRQLEAEIETLSARLGVVEARAAELSDELTRARAALHATRAQVASEIAQIRTTAASLADALTREEEARGQVEAELVSERDRAAAEITLLQFELDRRSEIHATVYGQLRSLGAEVAHVRDAVAGEDTRRRAVEGTLLEVTAATTTLRAQVEELEQRRDEVAGQLQRARAALVERDADLGRAHGEIAQARSETEAVRADAAREQGVLHAQLAEQRASFERQAAAAEQSVAALRAQLADAEQAVALERDRAEVAEAESVLLAAELARRTALDEHVRDTLAALRHELSEVQAGESARLAREAAVERLVADLVGTARELREAFDQELDVVRGEVESRAADARASDLLAADARLGAMRDHLEDSVALLRGQLADEQAARSEAEHALEAERVRTEMAGLAAVDAAVAREDLAQELAARRAAEADARAALAAAEEELELLRREPAADQADALLVVESLTRAARRLREESVVVPEAEAPITITETRPAEPARSALSPAAVPTPASSPVHRDGAVPVRPYVVPAAARIASPWLAGALERLTVEDPELALAALLELLVAQGPAVDRDLRYDMTIRGRGTWRVTMHDGAAVVGLPGRGESSPDLMIVGDLASLVPLAAGGATRRMPGVDVVGGRRRLRKITKARRAPVDLAEVHQAGAAVRPSVLLPLLVGEVAAAAVDGEPLVVDYEIRGRTGGTWRILAVPGAGLRLEVPDADAPAADAVVHIADVALLPLLAALPLPPGERLLVTGDLASVQRLHGWLAAAQGLPPAAAGRSAMPASPALPDPAAAPPARALA